MKLGGFLCLKDATAKDYCWRESIASILPVCDVVALSIASGDDVTEAECRELAAAEPKISLNIYPWSEPVGNPWWYNQWLQYARMHTPADRVLQIDADEVLGPESYPEIESLKNREGRFTVVMRRLNFWRDHKHLIPDGVCCGTRVIRMAPQDMYLASDGYDPKGEEAPRIAIESGATIYHYGFIRKKAAFFEKERFIQKAYFDTFDPRLEAAEKHEGNWMEKEGVTGWESKLDTFSGTHPAAAMAWLKERRYE